MRLYLLGVGPGDPELITLRALHLIQRLPVLFYPPGGGAGAPGPQGGEAPHPPRQAPRPPAPLHGARPPGPGGGAPGGSEDHP
ncbi:SAM-dependent methyltransferase [Thermus sp. 2.9]|uniref:SAM-dependent methyltransferase n=1 Tax=Thermus sp. (strain 2.9) TaxID=1577051 RepID=UPI002101BC6D|nr:SAM-dependent methyltransferase [Thermus sp. 2.9]